MEVIKNNFKPVCSKPVRSKPVRPKKVRSKKVRCKYCKSKLKITYDDLWMYYNTVDIHTSYYFKCPCCNEMVYLSLRKGRKLKK